MTDQENLLLPEAVAVAESADCDILLLNGPLLFPVDQEVAQLCKGRQGRRNLLFMLVTTGGDADAAYRLATTLQNHYETITCYVTGYCKSAGTLVAIGAHSLVMSDCGELGPVDVQLYKEDEIGERRSGLTVLSALKTLHEQAFDAFEHFMLSIKFRSGGSITARTATEVTANLTGRLMEPIYGHIDAMHIGEAGRSLRIAHEYGELLDSRTNNLRKGTLDRLTNDYPVHTFVIDQRQAERLFHNVRERSAEEVLLASKLGEWAVFPRSAPSDKLLAFLNSENHASRQEDQEREDQGEVLCPGGESLEDPGAHSGAIEGHTSGRPREGSTQDPAGVPKADSSNGRPVPVGIQPTVADSVVGVHT